MRSPFGKIRSAVFVTEKTESCIRNEPNMVVFKKILESIFLEKFKIVELKQFFEHIDLELNYLVIIDLWQLVQLLLLFRQRLDDMNILLSGHALQIDIDRMQCKSGDGCIWIGILPAVCSCCVVNR